jgi:hypothetical protein
MNHRKIKKRSESVKKPVDVKLAQVFGAGACQHKIKLDFSN